ncbi:MAG: nitroreductase family protein [Lachnospiraceae bacterium]|nr:nitroreductase family protein [Lachnospiraceae bacterium]
MLHIDQDLCIQCNACVDECSMHCLSLDGNEVKYDATKCIFCGHCMAVCPKEVLWIDGDGYDIEEVEEYQFIDKTMAYQVRNDIITRRSVRSFNDQEVSTVKLNKILEVAKYAPTAKNCQQNALMVLNEPEEIDELVADISEKLGELGESMKETNPKVAEMFLAKYKEFKEEGKDGIFYGAPLVIMVFSPSDVDGTLCAATMAQMITVQDLGFCYIGLANAAMNSEELRAKYNIPADKHCVISMAIGYYDAEYFCTVPRKEVPLIFK